MKGYVVQGLVYINGWYQDTEDAHRGLLHIAMKEFDATDDFSKPLTMKINAGDLKDYGQRYGGKPGTIFIDFDVMDIKANRSVAKPDKFFSGTINTVSPI
ncbi:hypothetical protein [Ochrobactrum sp. RH2CCR150]|uniref:hypothetical protein n=1 Tax=Ochrobactrum sp. RH2CCR150 TaxID=2587044 RepID=UPI0015F90510|nr:hypothetical protein [Ochrobactrum sp. RH2CCR150]